MFVKAKMEDSGVELLRSSVSHEFRGCNRNERLSDVGQNKDLLGVFTFLCE